MRYPWLIAILFVVMIALAAESDCRMTRAGELQRAQINEAPRPRVDLVVGPDHKDPYSWSAHTISHFRESAWLDRYIRQAHLPVAQRTVWHGVYPTDGPIYRGSSWMSRRIPKVPAVLVTSPDREVLYFAVVDDPAVPLPADAATLERNVRYALSQPSGNPATGGANTQPPREGRGAEFAGTSGDGEAGVFGRVVPAKRDASLQPGFPQQWTESLDQGIFDGWKARRAAKKAGTSGGTSGPADDEPPPTPKSAAIPLKTVAAHPSGQPARFCENGECRTAPEVQSQQPGGILSGLSPLRREEPQPYVEPYRQPYAQQPQQGPCGSAQWPGGGVQVDPYGVRVQTPRGNVDINRQFADPYNRQTLEGARRDPYTGARSNPAPVYGQPYGPTPGQYAGQPPVGPPSPAGGVRGYQLPPVPYAGQSALAAPAYGLQQQYRPDPVVAPSPAALPRPLPARRRGVAVPSGWGIQITGPDFKLNVDANKAIWSVGPNGEASTGEFKMPVVPKGGAKGEARSLAD